MCSALTKIHLAPTEFRDILSAVPLDDIRLALDQYARNEGTIFEAEQAKKECLKRFIERQARVVGRVTGVAPFIPHQHFDPDFSKGATPQEVREFEGNQMEFHTNLVVALLDEPTTGGGIELGWSEVFGIPAITLSTYRVSRLPRGLRNITAEIIYETEDDAERQLEQAVPRELWCEAYRRERLAAEQQV